MAEQPIRIPKSSIATHVSTLVECFVAEGMPVEEGAVLFSVETDKVEQEIDAPASGTVHWEATVGDEYDVGARIGFIETAE